MLHLILFSLPFDSQVSAPHNVTEYRSSPCTSACALLGIRKFVVTMVILKQLFSGKIFRSSNSLMGEKIQFSSYLLDRNIVLEVFTKCKEC